MGNKCFPQKANTLETHLGTRAESFILIYIFLYSPASEVKLHLKMDCCWPGNSHNGIAIAYIPMNWTIDK